MHLICWLSFMSHEASKCAAFEKLSAHRQKTKNLPSTKIVLCPLPLLVHRNATVLVRTKCFVVRGRMRHNVWWPCAGRISQTFAANWTEVLREEVLREDKDFEANAPKMSVRDPPWVYRRERAFRKKAFAYAGFCPAGARPLLCLVRPKKFSVFIREQGNINKSRIYTLLNWVAPTYKLPISHSHC